MNIVLNRQVCFSSWVESCTRSSWLKWLNSICSQALGDQIIFVTRPDKKKILFYNDKHCQFTVDEGELKICSLLVEERLLFEGSCWNKKIYFDLKWWLVIRINKILTWSKSWIPLYSLKGKYALLNKLWLLLNLSLLICGCRVEQMYHNNPVLLLVLFFSLPCVWERVRVMICTFTMFVFISMVNNFLN